MGNNLKKCPKCGSEVANVATECPICGYNFLIPQIVTKTKGKSIKGICSLVISIIALLSFSTKLGFVLSMVGLCLGVYVLFAKKEINYGTAIAGVVISLFALILFSSDSITPKEYSDKENKKSTNVVEKTKTPISDSNNSKKNEQKNNEEQSKKTPIPKKQFTPKPNKQTKKKKLTKVQYKKQCKLLYHDSIFFTKKNLEGKKVRLRLFIGEKKFFDTYVDSRTSDFIKKNKIQRTFYNCYVKRKGSTSYVSGGTVDVYLPANFKESKYKTGSYITVYGKVADFSTNTWTGYNSVSVVAKYIEKGKR